MSVLDMEDMNFFLPVQQRGSDFSTSANIGNDEIKNGYLKLVVMGKKSRISDSLGQFLSLAKNFHGSEMCVLLWIFYGLEWDGEKNLLESMGRIQIFCTPLRPGSFINLFFC